jgi:hypothetical protein
MECLKGQRNIVPLSFFFSLSNHTHTHTLSLSLSLYYLSNHTHYLYLSLFIEERSPLRLYTLRTLILPHSRFSRLQFPVVHKHTMAVVDIAFSPTKPHDYAAVASNRVSAEERRESNFADEHVCALCFSSRFSVSAFCTGDAVRLPDEPRKTHLH